MQYLKDSEAITGYRVKIIHREPFIVVGFTRIYPPDAGGEVPHFYDELIADGRLDKLRQASAVRPWIMGLGSWDPECPKKGSRYTISIEETGQTDFTRLEQEYPLFRKQIGASDWMCFEMTHARYMERFWRDNPYKMMGQLGYQFYGTPDFSTGLHFDAYPPEFNPAANPDMEFRITVKKV
jgi:hypothetical protein